MRHDRYANVSNLDAIMYGTIYLRYCRIKFQQTYFKSLYMFYIKENLQQHIYNNWHCFSFQILTQRRSSHRNDCVALIQSQKRPDHPILELYFDSTSLSTSLFALYSRLSYTTTHFLGDSSKISALNETYKVRGIGQFQQMHLPMLKK